MRWEIEDTPERTAFRAEFRTGSETHSGHMDGTGRCGRRRRPGTVEKPTSGFQTRSCGKERSDVAPIGARCGPRSTEDCRARRGCNRVDSGPSSSVTDFPRCRSTSSAWAWPGPQSSNTVTEAQKERYLRKILSPRRSGANFFSEPGSGSDPGVAVDAGRAATATSGS